MKFIWFLPMHGHAPDNPETVEEFKDESFVEKASMKARLAAAGLVIE